MAGGRPTKYKPEYVKIAKKLCELGATDLEVASALGISHDTLYRWKREKQAFSDALKVGKDACDDRVEMSLYKRAIGYEQENVKVFQYKGEEVIIPYTEKVQPDTTAAIFWLKNRRPDQYRANPEPESPDEAGKAYTIQIVEAKKPE